MKPTTTNTTNQTDINLDYNYANTMATDTDTHQHQQLQTQTTYDITDTATGAGAQTYYRSRIFTPFGGDNPLVGSAAILLSLLNRLRTSHHFSDAFNLQNQLLNEIH